MKQIGKIYGAVGGIGGGPINLVVLGYFFGIGSSIVGRTLNKKMDNKAVDKLFIGLMVLTVCIYIYHAARAFIG